ncbi:MAG TPA: PAS domain S-box protein [bacterium]|nr:PAS domain S-box protein [bacterium]
MTEQKKAKKAPASPKPVKRTTSPAGTTMPQSEEKCRIIFDEAAEGIVLMPINGTTLWVNKTFARMHGYESPEEMLHLRLNDLDAPGTAALAPDRLQRLIAGETLNFDVEHYRKDGSTFFLNVSCKVVEIEGERYFLGLHQDITDRKRAEESLRRGHDSLLAIFGGIDEPVYVADMDTHEVLFVNRVAETLWGVPGDRKCYEYLQNRNAPCPFCTNDKIRGEYRDRSYIWEFQNERTQRWFRCIDKAIPWPDGRTVRYEMAIDITDRKKAEEEREKLRDQLAQAQKMESIGRLAGGIAHDFNNMLSVILGHAEMAQDRLKPDDPLRADLRKIHRAAERSADLTRQLLAFARKQTVAPRVLDLNATVAGMLDMLKRLIGEDIDLAWMPGADAGRVRMDPSQIDQILANLCVNARDAIADTGKITIETGSARFDEKYCAAHHDYKKGDYVLLAVSDSGCGMDADTLSRIFEPFFTTKERGKGTGLGLSTVYGIVRQNCGFINVYSEPGRGTTFRIYLPRSTEQIAAAPAKKESGDAPKSSGETILLVEDEPMIRDITRKMLDILGYRVVVAATPGEAIRLAREHAGTIHLLLTDVVMPEMNGRELARNLLSLYPDLKRLFMSGYTANVIAHHGVLDPGVHFLQKPFSMNDLAHKVREALTGS